jgi:hypothetical protein
MKVDRGADFARLLSVQQSDADIIFTETNPTSTRGGGLSSPPTNHNGLSRCPAEAIRSSGTTAPSRISESASGNSTVSAFLPRKSTSTWASRTRFVCPYCATRFRFDPRLEPSEADPPDSLFVDPDPE